MLTHRSVASLKYEFRTANITTNCYLDNLRNSAHDYANSVRICGELTSMGMHFCLAGVPSPDLHSGQSDSRGHANRSLCLYVRCVTRYPDVFSSVIRHPSAMAKVASATRALITTAQPNKRLQLTGRYNTSQVILFLLLECHSRAAAEAR